MPESSTTHVLHRGTPSGDFYSTPITNLESLSDADLIDTDVAQVHPAVVTKHTRSRDTLARAVTAANYPLRIQRLRALQWPDPPRPVKHLYYGPYASFMPTHDSRNASLSLTRSLLADGQRARSGLLAERQDTSEPTNAADKALAANRAILRRLIRHQRDRLLRGSADAVLPSHIEHTLSHDAYVENRRAAHDALHKTLHASPEETKDAAAFVSNAAPLVADADTPLPRNLVSRGIVFPRAPELHGALDPRLRNPVTMYED